MMTKRFLMCLVLALALALCFGVALADIETVHVEGRFGQSEARSMLSMINDFRTGPDAWYWSSDDTTKVECTGLQPLVYDYDLEKVAMQRAIEIAMSFSHQRPNGDTCFSAYSLVGGYYSSRGENIAAGYGTASSVFVGWQEIDDNYAGQGHRRNMLNSGFNCVGIGHVVMGGCHYWTQEFGYSSSPATAATGAADDTRGLDVAVDCTTVRKIFLQGVSSVETTYGEQVSLPTQAHVCLMGTWGPNGGFPVDLSYEWTAKDDGVARISAGRMSGVAAGSTTLETRVLGHTLSVDATVYPALISRANPALTEKSFGYGGVARTPGVTATDGGRALTLGTDYTLSYENNVNAGTATAVVTGKGNYRGTVSLDFTIAPAGISGATIGAIDAVEYTGEAIEPDVSVKLGQAQLSGDDYTVAYKGNTRAGEAVVTVTGKGNYSGTVTGSFTILPVDLTKCTVADIKVQRYTGKAITPTLKITFGGSSLNRNRDYSARYSDNTGPGEATVTITGRGNYTGSVVRTFTIDEVVNGLYKDKTGWYRVSSASLAYIKPLKSQKVVVIPDSIKVKGKILKVTEIEPKAFQKDAKLTNITLGKNIKTIGKRAFSGCARLTAVKGGAGLVTIGDSAFLSCSALKSITLPKGVRKIGASAFKGCKALKTITVNTTDLKASRVGSDAFKGISAKAVFKCPKKQVKTYRTLFRKKGAPSKATFK